MTGWNTKPAARKDSRSASSARLRRPLPCRGCRTGRPDRRLRERVAGSTSGRALDRPDAVSS
jgi:hypothetical protein